MVRNFLLAAAIGFASVTAVQAADFPEPVTDQASVSYNWSAFNVGVFGGLAAGDIDNLLTGTDPAGVTVLDATIGQTFGGGFAGGTLGYDHQFGMIVAGIAADIAWSEAEANTSINVSAPGAFSADAGTVMDWFGTIRGRLGFAFDNILVYGTGGYGWAGLTTSVNAPGYSNEWEDTYGGFVYGGGIEVGATERISIGAEYLYFDADEGDVATIDLGGGNSLDIDHDLDTHTVKAFAKYRF